MSAATITKLLNSPEFKARLFETTSELLATMLTTMAQSLRQQGSDTTPSEPTSSKSAPSAKSEPDESEDSDSEPEGVEPESDSEESDSEASEPEESESSDSEEEEELPQPKGKNSKTQPKGKAPANPKAQPKTKGKEEVSPFEGVDSVNIVKEFSAKSFVILGEEFRHAFPDIKSRFSDKLSVGAGLVVEKGLFGKVTAMLKKQKVKFTIVTKEEATTGKVAAATLPVAAKSKASQPKSKIVAKPKASQPKTSEPKADAAKSKKASKKDEETNPEKVKKNRWGNLEEVGDKSGVVYHHIEGAYVAVGTQDTGVRISVKGLASVNALDDEEKKVLKKRGFTVLTPEIAAIADKKDKEALLDLLEPEQEEEEEE